MSATPPKLIANSDLSGIRKVYRDANQGIQSVGQAFLQRLLLDVCESDDSRLALSFEDLLLSTN